MGLIAPYALGGEEEGEPFNPADYFRKLEKCGSRALLLDYDGTLAPSS